MISSIRWLGCMRPISSKRVLSCLQVRGWRICPADYWSTTSITYWAGSSSGPGSAISRLRWPIQCTSGCCSTGVILLPGDNYWLSYTMKMESGVLARTDSFWIPITFSSLVRMSCGNSISRENGDTAGETGRIRQITHIHTLTCTYIRTYPCPPDIEFPRYALTIHTYKQSHR